MPEISLCANAGSIHEAMTFLREHLSEEYDSLRTYVELAVEELLVNVASYAYGDDAEKQSNHGKLILGCRWVNMDGQRQFCVWLRDWGKPYDPFSSQTPDTSLSLDERKIGGLGIHLIKHVSSHYVYRGSDGSNVVELFFKTDGQT